jgi:hypothetical protein
MRSTIFRIGFGVLMLSLVTASAFTQGRGRGQGKKSDVFFDRHDARDGRFEAQDRNQNRKCGVFVNCHDARNGRWDGRGPNRSFARGTNVGYRHRYNMNDYWQRRHMTYRNSDMSSRWRYHNRTWRER